MPVNIIFIFKNAYMSLLSWLDKIDKILFILIHNDRDHAVLDNIMLVLRNPYTWIPLYGFILFYVIKRGDSKKAQFIVLSILTISITDGVTARIFKQLFGRVRPCLEPQIHSMIRNLVDCSGIYSFPSSHAANHFGLAAFWYWSVWLMTGRKWDWLCI